MTTRAGVTTDVIEVSDSFLSNCFNGPIALFSGNPMEAGLARGAAVTTFVAGLIGGSMLARKRVAEGKAPLLGVIG